MNFALVHHIMLGWDLISRRREYVMTKGKTFYAEKYEKLGHTTVMPARCCTLAQV